MFSFSKPIKHEKLCRWSPNGKYLATNEEFSCHVRSVETLELLHSFTCLDSISRLEWSVDSQYLLAAQYERGMVQICSLQHPSWLCRIEESKSGVVFACWVPKRLPQRFVLTVARSMSHMTVWSLDVASAVCRIQYPKYGSKACEFSHDGRYLAVCLNFDKDYIAIYSTDDWKMLRCFYADCKNVEDLAWSSDDKYICVWDNPLQYRLILYTNEGYKLAVHETDQSLGVRSLVWSPSGQLIAVGGFDGGCRLYNNLTWRPISEYRHANSSVGPTIAVYREKYDMENRESTNQFTTNLSVVMKSLEGTLEQSLNNAPTIYETCEPNIQLASKPIKWNTVGLLEWSHDGKFLATRDDQNNHILWVWETSKLALHSIVVQIGAVTAAKWHPSSNRLIICTGNNRLYMWSPKGCCVIDIPIYGFLIYNLRWNSSGNALLLVDEKSCCVCYLEGTEDFDGTFIDTQTCVSPISSRVTASPVETSSVKKSKATRPRIHSSPVVSNPLSVTKPPSISKLENPAKVTKSHEKILIMSPSLSARSSESDRCTSNLIHSAHTDMPNSDFSNSVTITDRSWHSEDSVHSNFSTLSLQSIASSQMPLFDSALSDVAVPSVTQINSKLDSVRKDNTDRSNSKTSDSGRKSSRVIIPTLDLQKHTSKK